VPDEAIDALEQRTSKTDETSGNSRSSKDDNALQIPDPKSITYTDYDDPFALVDDASGAPHIRELSRNAWVGCGGDVYVLECMGKGFIRIEPVKADEDIEARFRAHYTPASLPMVTALTLKISPYQQSREILTAATLVEAINGADTYATSKVLKGTLVRGILRSAKWRREPATDNQKKYIEKRWKSHSSTFDAEERPGKKYQTKEQKLATINKGEAANIITRLKHGAQTRYEKKQKEKQKAMESLLRERQRKAREDVAVGPLPLSV